MLVGAELLYRDTYFNQMYEAVVNLTPAARWHMGKGWETAVQVTVPVYNDYGARYKRIRPTMGVVSRQMKIGKNDYLKVSAGLFGSDRYGLDAKWFHPLNKYVALDAQLGVTGYCSMAVDWECSQMKRVTGWVGVEFFEPKNKLQVNVHGGRFLYEDYGVIGECMRHFKHVTVGLYGQYTDEMGTNGGFKVVLALPPFKRKHAHRVNVYPASHFRLTYNAGSDVYSAKSYMTNPEENEADGYFYPSLLHWGAYGTKE